MRMQPRSFAARAALWAAVFALVLRAGMPLLAVAAAQRIGLPLGEVCEVYGVVLPGAHAASMAAHAHHHAGHAGHAPHRSGAGAEPGCEHCALSALGTLGGPTGLLPAVEVRLAAGTVPLAPKRAGPVHDACAAWAARIGHGPPVRA